MFGSYRTRTLWAKPLPLSLVWMLLAAFSALGQGIEHPLLSLHDAIQQSQSSPQAHQAQDAVDAARGMIVQAGLRPNPRLYLQSEDLRPWASNFDFPNSTEDYAYLGQLLELGGKRGKRLDVAKAYERQAEAERTLMTQQIAGRVANAYWTTVISQAIAKLLERDLQAVDGIVRYNKERVDAGAGRGVDLIRVEMERDRLRLTLESAHREVVLNRIELFRQIGRKPMLAVELTDKLDSTAPIQQQSLPVVLAARADAIVAREAVAAAEAEVKLQSAVGVPDLDVLAGYKRNTGNNTLYSGLQLPLAFRNRNQGEVARARANLQLAKDKLQQLELFVAADVQSAEESYTHQRAVVQEILPDMRAHANHNLTIMDDAYRSGGTDLLHFLDAERAAFDAEVTALRTLEELQQAALRLQLAYGVHP